MLVGYGRVSTQDQNLDLQRDAFRAAGCERVFEDKASGSKAERPGLTEALAYMRPGDTLVVWKLDRLGRSIKNLIETIQTLQDRGVGFKSLQENIDTTTSGGKLIFHIFASLAEFERSLIRERTVAGLAAARARGRTGGRKRSLTDRQIEQMRTLAQNSDMPVSEICKTFGVSRNTFYRNVPKPFLDGAGSTGSS